MLAVLLNACDFEIVPDAFDLCFGYDFFFSLARWNVFVASTDLGLDIFPRGILTQAHFYVRQHMA